MPHPAVSSFPPSLKFAWAGAAGAILWLLLRPDTAGALPGPATLALETLGVAVISGWGIHRGLGRLWRAAPDTSPDPGAEAQCWQRALDQVSDGAWEMDLATRHTRFSEKWKSLTGLAGPDAGPDVGPDVADWTARVHPDDRPHVERELQRCLGGEIPTYSCEHRLRTGNNAYLWVLTRGTRMPATGSTPRGRLIGTHTDITARKLSDERNADMLAFLRTVLRSSSTGIIAYRASGPAIIANEAAARILQTGVPQLLRQNFRELASWHSSLLADAERALATNQETVHHGSLETPGHAAIWVEAHLVPFQYAGEQHLLFLLTDETDKRRADEKLHLLQEAVQAAPVGWLVTDARGIIEWVNPGFTALTGYAAEDVVGRTPNLLKSGRHGPEYYAAMWQRILRGEVWSGELINRRKDGTEYHESSTVAPIRNEHGDITHFVAIKQETTERKLLEQQLARAQRLESIGLLACGIAHDLNNMLCPITLALNLISAKHSDPETLGHLQMLEAAANRGAGVLRQVLTFGQGVEGERVPLHPKILLKEIAQLATETFPRQIRIRACVSAETDRVCGDITQLHQVLLNLAVNARDAMPEGGELTLYMENVLVDEARALRQITPVKPGRFVCLGVRDTGTGIPPAVLEHIFEPFYTTKPRGKGSGLGLSTVFGIVRSHGGFVEVETTPGHGTHMRIILPAVSEAAGDSGKPAVVAVSLTGAGRRVLVAEDEPAVRKITGILLRKRGFEVVEARDGREALALFQAGPDRFAAVVTDLMMPESNGYQLIGHLRRLKPQLPIVATTGMSGGTMDEDGSEVLRSLNVPAPLRKPYVEQTLIAALRDALDGKRPEPAHPDRGAAG